MAFVTDLALLEAFHVSHIMNHLLRFVTEGILRAIILQIGDQCIFVWSRIRSSSSRLNAACEIHWILKSILGSIFPSSATNFLVLVAR